MQLTTLESFLSFSATLAVTSAITPVVRKIAYARDITDKPDGLKKIQVKPIAYLGGIAVAAGFTISILSLIVLVDTTAREIGLITGIVFPALFMACIGLADDLAGLGVHSRFFSQTFAAIATSGIAYAFSNTRTAFWIGAINFCIVTFWVVGITNSINLLDNINGLATGSSAISALFFGSLAFNENQNLTAALSFTLAASCIGFLFFNFPKATIYLGDAGALFIGFMLAVIALRLDLQVENIFISFLVKIMILFLPIIDTLTVIISRARRGISPFVGGRDHLSHRLLARGISPLLSVMTLFLFQATIALVAVILYLGVRT
jgi:UDP-GlcNAc:undecaprenyl-phosphate GlcNAc-1-phosphate transferase